MSPSETQLLPADRAIVAAMPAVRHSRQAQVVWGSRVVTVGGGAPVRVQSMTTPTPWM